MIMREWLLKTFNDASDDALLAFMNRLADFGISIDDLEVTRPRTQHMNCPDWAAFQRIEPPIGGYTRIVTWNQQPQSWRHRIWLWLLNTIGLGPKDH